MGQGPFDPGSFNFEGPLVHGPLGLGPFGFGPLVQGPLALYRIYRHHHSNNRKYGFEYNTYISSFLHSTL